jgi:transcription elongation factor Elf1
MSTIAEHFPELKNTDEYIKFQCVECGNINGSTIHIDGSEFVAVCGNCWAKQKPIPVKE